MIHGGGWIHGDKSQMDNWCQRFAQAGFTVANIDYRLASPHGTTPGWPNFQIADTQLAIRWMRAHAAELNLDPTRLCAYGTSAGGYLAVFTANLPKILPGNLAAIAPNIPVTLSCVADAFGPVDLTIPHFQAAAFTRLTGYTQAQNPTLYRNDSPLFYVTPHTPPMLLIHGTQDRLVPIAQSRELSAALQRDNVATQLLTYPGDHSFKGLSPAAIDSIFQQITAFLKTHTTPTP